MNSTLNKRSFTQTNWFSLLLICCFLFSVQFQLSAQNIEDARSLRALNQEEVITKSKSHHPGQPHPIMVYAYLFVNNEGTVVFDKGNGGAPVLNPRTRKTHKSIIGALNQLSKIENWKVVHYFDVTKGNENPSFMMYRIESSN